MIRHLLLLSFFFFNDTATTEIYTLSLHDALPICLVPRWMLHEGIYFFFEHASHGALPGDESIPFHPPGKAGAGDPQNIHARQLEQEIKPGRHCSDGPEVARAGMARTYR